MRNVGQTETLADFRIEEESTAFVDGRNEQLVYGNELGEDDEGFRRSFDKLLEFRTSGVKC